MLPARCETSLQPNSYAEIPDSAINKIEFLIDIFHLQKKILKSLCLVLIKKIKTQNQLICTW